MSVMWTALSRRGRLVRPGARRSPHGDVADRAEWARSSKRPWERSVDSTPSSTTPASPGRQAGWTRSILKTGIDASKCALPGQFNCTRLAVPHLRKSQNASIVNLSSAAGRFGFPLRTPYAAAKWAVIGFTKSLSRELGAGWHPRERDFARHCRGRPPAPGARS